MSAVCDELSNFPIMFGHYTDQGNFTKAYWIFVESELFSSCVPKGGDPGGGGAGEVEATRSHL